MVSAYYSPLPNQRFYMRGSYEADKILNGRGTNGADGTPVYVGMVAAPRTYPFGTRINIPGLGVGEVHDRGGAIVTRRNYDRIDVWMGKGEEGLARALNWGMRLVEGEVDFGGDTLQPAINFEWISATLPPSTLNRLMAKSTLKSTVVTTSEEAEPSQENIEQWQDALRFFGYYHGKINGQYTEETKQAIITFQLNEGIIKNKNEPGAGRFGPKTSARLKEIIDSFNSDVLQEKSRLKGNLERLTSGLGKEARGEQVYQLQNMLWELGYYLGPFNGVYEVMTIDAVFRFQKDYGVIKDNHDGGAGYFGPKTHSALTAAIHQKAEKITQGPKQMQSWVPAAVSLPQLSELTFNETPPRRPKLVFQLEQPIKLVFEQNLNPSAKGDEIRKLQKTLMDRGFLAQGLETGYYGDQTKQAVIKFQLANGVISAASDPGAGRVGPGTRAALNQL